MCLICKGNFKKKKMEFRMFAMLLSVQIINAVYSTVTKMALSDENDVKGMNAVKKHG